VRDVEVEGVAEREGGQHAEERRLLRHGRGVRGDDAEVACGGRGGVTRLEGASWERRGCGQG
jgi:hypothetical protein